MTVEEDDQHGRHRVGHQQHLGHVQAPFLVAGGRGVRAEYTAAFLVNPGSGDDDVLDMVEDEIGEGLDVGDPLVGEGETGGGGEEAGAEEEPGEQGLPELPGDPAGLARQVVLPGTWLVTARKELTCRY